jgi:hypothetical protein
VHGREATVGWWSEIVVRHSGVGVRMRFLSRHSKLAAKWSSLESLLHTQLKHRGGQLHLMVKCCLLLGHMCACLLVRWPVWPQTLQHLYSRGLVQSCVS